MSLILAVGQDRRATLVQPDGNTWLSGNALEHDEVQDDDKRVDRPSSREFARGAILGQAGRAPPMPPRRIVTPTGAGLTGLGETEPPAHVSASPRSGTLDHFPDGSTYEGEYILVKGTRLRHGHGEHFYPDGDHYSGQWVNNKKQGHGEMKYADNVTGTYDGQWSQ